MFPLYNTISTTISILCLHTIRTPKRKTLQDELVYNLVLTQYTRAKEKIQFGLGGGYILIQTTVR